MNESDEEIINLYKNGDIGKLKVLIERYTPHIYNFVYKHGAKDEATDITQEIFIKVWKNLGKFNEEKASFKTWLFTIARNTTTDFLRKKKSVLFSDLETTDVDMSFSENIPDTELLPHEKIEKLEVKESLEKTVEHLPLNYQTILTLYYQEEMTFGEIGKVLSKPLNTVKSWHRRALIKLRELIQD